MPSVIRGILISFEGTEGSGKSTLIGHLSTQLKELGQSVIQTREPGGSDVAEKIRSILLGTAMDPWTELLLYEAARAEHLAKTVRPALDRGEIVLCDRFTDSTLAYQSSARGLPWKEIKVLNRMATSGLKPDLTVLLDIDPAVGLKRARDPNRFEAEGVEFQKKVRKGFLKARSEDPKRWLTLKSESGTPDEIAQMVIRHLKTRFKKRFKNLQETRRG